MPKEDAKQSATAVTAPPEETAAKTELGRDLSDLISLWNVIDARQAVIEFDPSGTVLYANKNFLETVGYAPEEVIGKHHRMFCSPEYAASDSYRQFWIDLAAGSHHEGLFERFGKNGKGVWLQAFYSPVLDEAGQVVRIIKLATDVTAEHRQKLEVAAKIAALNKVQAVAEFDLNGTILAANENFLKTMGYTAEEIVGRHHRMFCEDSYTRSAAYKEFWAKLARGEADSGEYKRFGKNNKEVWIQASYNPVFDESGKPFKIVKYATDITETTMRNVDFQAKVSAINRAQAAVEFDLRGFVLTANQNFLDLMDYKLEDIVGQHHRMFCDPAYAASAEYRDLWDRLNAGQYVPIEAKRLGRNNKEVWIQGAYNPVLNRDGQPIKVIKYAADITERKTAAAEYQSKLNAMSKSQAVIEFDVEGNILTANQNFLDAVGYTLREIVGKHHKIFCDADYVASDEYRGFWAKLARGEFCSGRYQRVGKLGHQIWLQATYNPVLDAMGNPYKVVKYATDITAQVRREREVDRVAEQIRARNEQVQENARTLSASIQRSSAQSTESGKNAEKGARLLTKSAEAIAEISKISNDVTEIVKNIGEVANQTNLLAFNAAIEAARAGQHGLGFAVVADEVRKLAERSSQATRDISRLLMDSQGRVHLGGEVFRQAEEVFRTITEAANREAEDIAAVQNSIQQQVMLTSDIAKITEHLVAKGGESKDPGKAAGERGSTVAFQALEAALKS